MYVVSYRECRHKKAKIRKELLKRNITNEHDDLKLEKNY